MKREEVRMMPDAEELEDILEMNMSDIGPGEERKE